ncbi:MAG: hypothetical protein R3E09_04475 [Novosphingobium sp.]|nr:hypothetical protein [Novosphingobium sp.]
MKLLRWAVAGASVYAVYKYSIGKKAKGEDVFVSPEREIEKLTEGEETAEEALPAKPKRQRSGTAKRPRK